MNFNKNRNRLFNCALILVIVSFFYIDASCQTIITQNYRKGLVDQDGSILIEPAYRGLDLVDERRGYYICQTKEDLFGIYIYESKKFIPCKYNEIIYKHDVFLVRENKLWGWIVPHQYDDSTNFILVEPQYATFQRLDYGYYLFGKSEKFGVMDFDYTAEIEVPMIYDNPIYYNKDFGFYQSAGNDSLLLIISGKEYDTSKTLKLSCKSVHNDGVIVHTYTGLEKELQLFDAKTGQTLPSYKHDIEKSHLFYYFEEWLCVVEKKRISWRKTEYNLRNPYTGEIFYSRILKGNEEFRLEGFSAVRNIYFPVDVVIYSHSGGYAYEVYEGKISHYNYKPLEQKKVVKSTYKSGNGKAPWFMPGSK